MSLGNMSVGELVAVLLVLFMAILAIFLWAGRR